MHAMSVATALDELLKPGAQRTDRYHRRVGFVANVEQVKHQYFSICASKLFANGSDRVRGRVVARIKLQ